MMNNSNACKANNSNSHDNSKRVGIYARVSTNHQNLDVQLTELRAVAKQRGWTIVDEYLDEGVSGSCTNRPELDRLLSDVKRGKLDLVCVWKLDRLGRSLQHLLQILDELTSLNVGFVSIRDNGIDTTTATGRLMLQLVAAFAEYERAMIRERVKAGILRAKDKGVSLGRPRRNFDVRAATALMSEGHGLKSMSRILNIPRTTLRTHLIDAGEWPLLRGSENPQAESYL